jgi:hypothetical protein
MRPFEVVGKIHVHADRCDGFLMFTRFVTYLDRKPDTSHPHFVDGDTAFIPLVLRIYQGI